MAFSLLVRMPDAVLQADVYIVGAGEANGRLGARNLAGNVGFGGAQGTKRPFCQEINLPSPQRPGNPLA